MVRHRVGAKANKAGKPHAKTTTRPLRIKKLKPSNKKHPYQAAEHHHR